MKEKELIDEERKELAKWFDRRIAQVALGVPENDWKYSDKQKAQKISLLILSGKKKVRIERFQEKQDGITFKTGIRFYFKYSSVEVNGEEGEELIAGFQEVGVGIVE